MVLVTIALLLLFGFQSFGVQRVFYLMGTYATIDLPEEKDVYKAYRILRELEETLSDYTQDSEIGRINGNAGIKAVEVSEVTLEVIKKSIEVSVLTGGAFDITVGSLTINHKRRGLLSREEAVSLIDFRGIVVDGNSVFLKKKGMALDLGGIGKGFALDVVRKRLKSEWGFISIGGDMTLWGKERVIGVRDPRFKEKKVFLYLSGGKDLCISTSGNYHRDHIDQRDKYLLQITVIHRNCYLADALATALFTMELSERRETIKRVKDLGVIEIYRDGSLWLSPPVFRYFPLIHFPGSNQPPNNETVSQ